jgi:hypothetical protein
MFGFGSPFYVLSSLALSLPLLLVCIGGMILAITYWPRYPRVALLVVIALVLACLDALLGLLVSMLQPGIIHLFGGTARQLGAFYFLIGITRALLGAVAWGFLIAAVFAGRGRLDAPRDERRA